MIQSKKTLYLILILFAGILMANRGGSPGGKTGSTTDKGTCSSNGGCHAGGSSTVTAQDYIQTNVPSSGYVPGQTYTVSLKPVRNGISVWGFEMMAEDANGNAVGEFISNSDANARDNGERATHKFTSTTGADEKLWDVSWKAPTAGTGSITFYAASLAANGNGTTGGDHVLTDTATIIEGAPSSVWSVEWEKVRVYPNPAVNSIHLKGLQSNDFTISIYNQMGKEIYSSNYTDMIDVSEFAKGIYYLKLTNGDSYTTKRFAKQ